MSKSGWSIASTAVFALALVFSASVWADLGEIGGDVSSQSQNDTSEPLNQRQSQNATLLLTPAQKLSVGVLVSRSSGSFCAGTLVDGNAVLTAAHCVQDVDPEKIRFAIGHDASRPLRVFPVSAVYVNPLFFSTAEHDNALCILERQASIEYPPAEPIAFNEEPLEELAPPLIGRLVQNIGYQRTVHKEDLDRETQVWIAAEVTALDRNTYSVARRGIPGICFGDSGAPTLIAFPNGEIRIIGTLHGGGLSCTDFDVFTRTDVDACWIKACLSATDRLSARAGNPCGQSGER